MGRAYGTIQDAYGDKGTNRLCLFLCAGTDEGRIAWQFVPSPSSKQEVFNNRNYVATKPCMLVAKQRICTMSNTRSHRLYKRVLAYGL